MLTWRTEPIMQLLLIALVASGVYGQTPAERIVMELMGHHVTMVTAKLDDRGFPEESAQVCFDIAPKPLCYSPSTGIYGLSPNLIPIQIGIGQSAILFSAGENFGGSGSRTHFAILRPGEVEVENLLPSDLWVSELGAHALMTDKSLSPSPIFVVADGVILPEEVHFGEHRYTVSAYVLTLRPDSETLHYDLRDQYMTSGTYSSIVTANEKFDILDSEMPEILARLKRVKAETERQANSPR